MELSCLGNNFVGTLGLGMLLPNQLTNSFLLMRAGVWSVFCSLTYLKHLEQWLTHGMYTTEICGLKGPSVV